MARENEGKALKTGRFFVGLSSIIGLTSVPGAVGPLSIHLVSGGTLEIVSGPTLSSTNTWGQGMLIDSTTTPIPFNMTGTVYFLTAGATTQVAYLQCLSAGYEV